MEGFKKWRAEYKQSPDYVQCRTYLLAIGQHSFCLITRLPAFTSLLSKELDCYENVWHHAACILEENKRIREYTNGRVFVVVLENKKIHGWNDVEGADTLWWRDQERLRNYIQEDVVGKYELDEAEFSGLVCRSCEKGIDKGQIIISYTEDVGDGRFQLSLHPQWHHATCLDEELQLPELNRSIPLSPPAPVRALSSSSVRIFDSEEKREMKARPDFGDDPLSISGKKRLYGGRGMIDCEASQKRRKTSGSEANAPFDGEEVARTIAKVKESLAAAVKDVSVVPELLRLLKIRQQQIKDLLELKNLLREDLSVTELKQMLAANDQDDTGSLDDLLERCADGMRFGAIARCLECRYYMEYRNQAYRCRGSLSGFNTCTSTSEARLVRSHEWSFGMACTNSRLLEPEPPVRAPVELFLEGTLKNPISLPLSENYFLRGCMFVTIGKFSVTQAKLKESIQAAGGFMRGGASSIESRRFLSDCPFRAIVTTEKALKDQELCFTIDYFRYFAERDQRPLPMVKEQFLLDCLDRKRLLPINDYTLEHTHITWSSERLKCRGN